METKHVVIVVTGLIEDKNEVQLTGVMELVLGGTNIGTATATVENTDNISGTWTVAARLTATADLRLK